MVYISQSENSLGIFFKTEDVSLELLAAVSLLDSSETEKTESDTAKNRGERQEERRVC